MMVFISNGKTTCFGLWRPSSGFDNFLALRVIYNMHIVYIYIIYYIYIMGRPRRRWVDNIRMDLQEVGCGYMDWIGLGQDRDRWRTLVSAVMNLRVP